MRNKGQIEKEERQKGQRPRIKSAANKAWLRRQARRCSPQVRISASATSIFLPSLPVFLSFQRRRKTSDYFQRRQQGQLCSRALVIKLSDNNLFVDKIAAFASAISHARLVVLGYSSSVGVQQQLGYSSCEQRTFAQSMCTCSSAVKLTKATKADFSTKWPR